MKPSQPSDSTTNIGHRLVPLRRELLSHAYRLTGSTSQAEDVVQDTIERVLRFPDHFNQGTNLRAWTHQILLNVVRTMGRRGRREGLALQRLKLDPCSWDIVQRSDRKDVVERELSPGTQRAIQALPSTFQKTVWLIDVEGISYRDAAVQLGVPIGTVMSRLHRGRRQLAAALVDTVVNTLPRPQKRDAMHELVQAA